MPLRCHRLSRICFFAMLLTLLPAAFQAVRAQALVQGLTWPEDGIRVAAIEVRIHDNHPDGFDWPGLTRALMGFKVGDRITREQLEQAGSRITPFGRVGFSAVPAGAGYDLGIDLEPYKRIKSIRIHNNYPLFDREVRNVMTVAPGDFFHPEAMQEQKKLIAERFRAEGYLDPQVTIDARQDPDDGNYHLSVHMDKGGYYKIGQIKLFGNKALADPLLLPQLKVWRNWTFVMGTQRFVELDLKQDVNALTTFYRNQGYADARVIYALERDPDKQQVTIILRITEGPRYLLTFSGNQAFSDRALASEKVFAETGNQGNIGLRRTLQNIRRRYLQAGYADVDVKWEEDSSQSNGDGLRAIRIDIDEGQRHKVVHVNIQGHRAIDSGTIYDQMLIRPARGFGNGNYVASVLQEDLDAIRALYLQKGFLEPLIENEVIIDPQTKAVSINLTIEEGVQTLVEEVTVSGGLPVPEQQLISALQLKKGDPYRPFLVQSDRDEIALQISPLGYPYVQVSDQVTLSPDRRMARIVYQVETGPLVEVGQVFFTGNFRTRDSVLQRQFSFDRGAPFSLNRVLEGQRRLRDLDVFDSVQVRTIGLKEKTRTVHLLVETTERAPYYFELGGGYQTDKGPYLRSKIGDRNVLGLNKEIHTSGEISAVGYRWDAGIGDPRFLGTDIRADFSIYLEREELFNQDFGTDSRGGQITFSRRWTPKITTDLAWRYEQRVQYLREDADVTETDPETLDNRRILVLTPSIGYDSRNSFIRPRQGVLAGLSMDVSRGLGNTLDNFVRYRLDLRNYRTIHPRVTLAGRLRLGYMYEYGIDGQIPEDQLFFLGGTTDVRGYGENLLRYDDQGDPVGGRQAVNASLEARIDLGHNFETSIFVDSGSVRDAPEGAGGDDDFHTSAGLGLHYITPIGPLSLMYGYKLNRREGEGSGQIHFAIGYTF